MDQPYSSKSFQRRTHLIYLLLFLLITPSKQLIAGGLDSLQQIIKTTHSDTIRIKALDELSYQLLYTDLDSCIKTAEIALTQLNQLEKGKGIPDSWKTNIRSGIYITLGHATTYKGNYPAALKYYQDSQKGYQEVGNEKGMATALGSIGMGLMNKGLLTESLEYYFKWLKIEEKLNRKNAIMSAYGNIAIAYNNLKEYEKALDYYNRALKMATELGIKRSVGIHLANIGIVYSETRQYDKAREYYLKALKIEEEIGNAHSVIQTRINIGNTYISEGKPEKALDYLLELDKSKLDDKNLEATVKSTLGEIYSMLKQYDVAEKYMLEALKITREVEDLDLQMDFEEKISSLYQKQGNFKKALEHYQAYISAKDSIFNKENLRKNLEAEMNYNFEKKEALQKAEHEKAVIALEAENRIQANNRNYIIVISLILLITISLAIVYYFNRRNLRLKAIHAQQLIISQEKERQRISKELHDSIGQNILFIKNQLQKKNDLALLPSIDETLEEVRAISKDLYPNQLERYGLNAAVEGLAEKVKEASSIFVSHDIEAIGKNLSAEQEINYYRIIQECVTNALKHSEATTLRISAVPAKGGVELTVQDNGKGFEKSILAKKAHRSFGMLNIEERVNFLKGRYELETSPGKGTRYTFHLPA